MAAQLIGLQEMLSQSQPTFSSFLNRNEKTSAYLALNVLYFLKKVQYHGIPMRTALLGVHVHARPPGPLYYWLPHLISRNSLKPSLPVTNSRIIRCTSSTDKGPSVTMVQLMSKRLREAYGPQ